MRVTGLIADISGYVCKAIDLRRSHPMKRIPSVGSERPRKDYCHTLHIFPIPTNNQVG